MTRTLPLALAALLLSSPTQAATPAQSCESAKLGAASKFSACRLKADSIYAKSAQTAADQAKRDAYRTRCDDALVKAYAAAELRHGVSCPSAGDVDAVMGYLTRCSTDVTGATGPPPVVPVPDYVAQLFACNASLSIARAGTATAADVASGKTFSSGAGLGVTGTANLNGLLETGETTPYGPGSDGAVQAGSERSFIDNGDGTVTDRGSGLVWEKKSDDGSIHDKDDRYAWCATSSPTAPQCAVAGNPMDGPITTVFLAALNTEPCFAGHCDWRIPNRTELLSLLNLQAYEPSTFPAFHASCSEGCTVTSCSCTKLGRYWSSSTYSASPGYAWGVDFWDSFTTANAKEQVPPSNSGFVRAVRGGS